MSKGKPKVSKSISIPAGIKQPRAHHDPDDANQLHPVWSIQHFDVDGDWGRNRIADGHLWDALFAKLKHYETMTWGEILKDKQHNHSVSVSSLTKEARERLAHMKQDDIDSVFRLRLTGKQRVWGIRDRHVLRLLWWDPEHEICPSALKNT